MILKDHQTPARWLIRLIWVCCAFMILRNLLPPNAFTATVLIFDYDFGLVRRGLIGELGNFWWGETVSKGEVFAASAVLTLAGVGALLAYMSRFLMGSMTGGLVLLVWVTSFAFAAIIASTGYLDLVLILLVAVALFLSADSIVGLGARLLVVGLGVLTHEVMLPYFVPFFMFEVWIANKDRPHAARGLRAGAPILAGLLVFGCITVWGQLPADQVADYIAHIDAKSEFTAEPEATVVMERDLAANLAMMAEKRGMLDYKSWVIFDGLPLLAMMLWVAWVNLRILGPASSVTRVLLVGAIMAPLSLNVIAFDVVRFGAISVLVGFLTLISQLRYRPQAEAGLNGIISLPMVLVVVVLNLFVGVNQMNTGDSHEFAVPWVLIKQAAWFQ